MAVATVNGIELNYRLEGDGKETIVLINGLADDLTTWELQVGDFVAAGYRVLRFDNRAWARAPSQLARIRAASSPTTPRRSSIRSA